MIETVLIIPCFNEAHRLQADALLRLAAAPGVSLLFVDDGSTDRTAERLAELKNRAPEQIDWWSLGCRSGKAEAVRRGLLRALESNPTVVGFFDADLATPPVELLRLVETARQTRALAVVGDRSELRAGDTGRPLARRVLGRVFASIASRIVAGRVHDTQCGAKVFRNTPVLAAALRAPFLSRWIFDVELIARLLWLEVPEAAGEAREVRPLMLREWHEKPGSHLRPVHMAMAAIELGWTAARVMRLRWSR